MEHALGTLSLWATEFPAQAEVASRSVFEHSVTLLYLLNDHTGERYASYFQDFIEREKSFLDRLKDTTSSELRKQLIQRQEALNARSSFVDLLTSELGVTSKSSRRWPSLLDRCRVLGLEETYRLYYSQLSAQGHADPEDVLNEMMMVHSGQTDLKALAIETVTFSWFMTLASFDVYLDAVHALSDAWGFQNVSALIPKIRERLVLISYSEVIPSNQRS